MCCYFSHRAHQQMLSRNAEITWFLFSHVLCFSAHNFGCSFQDLFHPGNKTGELVLRGGTVLLGNSYLRQAGPLGHACLWLVLHLTVFPSGLWLEPRLAFRQTEEGFVKSDYDWPVAVLIPCDCWVCIEYGVQNFRWPCWRVGHDPHSPSQFGVLWELLVTHVRSNSLGKANETERDGYDHLPCRPIDQLGLLVCSGIGTVRHVRWKVSLQQSWQEELSPGDGPCGGASPSILSAAHSAVCPRRHQWNTPRKARATLTCKFQYWERSYKGF